jgi:aspartate aminotransferase
VRLAYVDFDGETLLAHQPQRHDDPLALPALSKVRDGIQAIVEWLP